MWPVKAKLEKWNKFTITWEQIKYQTDLQYYKICNSLLKSSYKKLLNNSIKKDKMNESLNESSIISIFFKQPTYGLADGPWFDFSFELW